MLKVLFVLSVATASRIVNQDEVSSSLPRWVDLPEKKQWIWAADFSNWVYDHQHQHNRMFIVDDIFQECILSFRGSGDSRDWKTNLKYFPEEACGVKVHRGFVERLDELIGHSRDRQRKLAKCSTLIVTGHSLGGALASLYAQCAKAKGWKQADYLYTFAAPPVSDPPISNGGSCFKGARFYNYDGDVKYDPVPNYLYMSTPGPVKECQDGRLGYHKGCIYRYYHPVVEAIQLDWLGVQANGGFSCVGAFCNFVGKRAMGTSERFRARKFRCSSPSTTSLPNKNHRKGSRGYNWNNMKAEAAKNTNLVTTFLSHVPEFVGLDQNLIVKMHSMSTYLHRVKHLV